MNNHPAMTIVNDFRVSETANERGRGKVATISPGGMVILLVGAGEVEQGIMVDDERSEVRHRITTLLAQIGRWPRD